MIIKKYLLSNTKLITFELSLIITIKLQAFLNTKNAVLNNKIYLIKFILEQLKNKKKEQILGVKLR